MINKRILKAEMALYGDTQAALADSIPITRQSLSKKLNGHSEFTLAEMNAIRKRYNLPLETVASIFFAD